MKNLTRRKFVKLAGTASLGATVLKNTSSHSNPSLHTDTLAEAWLDVDLDNMAWNLAQIRQRINSRPTMAVIKCNAYGHGLVETGRFLEKQRVDFLAVGKIQEALQLRQDGVKTPILNLGAYSRNHIDEIARRSISQSIYTDDFTLLAEAGRKLKRKIKVHVKVDTGLGRLGVPYDRALSFIEKVAATPELEIEGVFTPFTEDAEFDRVQLARFLEVCRAAKRRGISVGLRHAASSAGVFSFPEAYLDMVRPGIMLYGQYPSTREYQARKIDLRPVMSLKTRILYLKELRPGESVSYHRAFIAKEATQVATLAAGYSDGYTPRAGGKAEVLVQGRRWPLIALVTSNHATINVSGASTMRVGEEAVLFGKQGETEISAEELAAWAETSVYRILIGMNPLLPRVYREGGKIK